MTLIIEDGNGRADAESYVSVAAFKAYCDARGLAYGSDDSLIEPALRRGTEYLDGAYRTRWLGRPVTPFQALGWPRAYVIVERAYLPSDKLPIALVRACCECALRELLEPGSLAPDLVPGERVVSESIGSLSVDYADNGGSDAGGPPVLVAVDRLLAPLLRSGAAAGLVLRA